jgi:hypothetical protein
MRGRRQTGRPAKPVDFEAELEIFRREVESLLQYFYAWMAMRNHPRKSSRVLSALNDSPLFWNTVAGAFETSTWVCLYRIFDQSSTYNVDRVLRIATDNANTLFAKDELGKRKRALSSNAETWLPAYLDKAYEPKPADFRALRKQLAAQRKIFLNSGYSDLRNKVHAHREFDGDLIHQLYARTKLSEVETLVAFLKGLYDVLWQLFHNGRKPTLRIRKVSGLTLLKRNRQFKRDSAVHKRITYEAVSALNAVRVGVAKR